MDLVHRIALEAPATIIDVGCGPGNSTEVLRRRWPAAHVTGLDNSEPMIREAQRAYPLGTWVLGDAAHMDAAQRYDLVFSNAVLQWVPNHAQLIPDLLARVAPRGALAVQVPANWGSPLHQALLAAAAAEPFDAHVAGCRDLLAYHEPAFYYDLLAPRSTRLALWETTYYHELADHRGLIEWYKGSGMRPYLQALPDDALRQAFEAAVLERAQPGYPLQSNGKVLYPFRRVFFVAYR